MGVTAPSLHITIWNFMKCVGNIIIYFKELEIRVNIDETLQITYGFIISEWNQFAVIVIPVYMAVSS